MRAGHITSVTDPYWKKPWDMNGEAWARERQFFIQMEKRPYMNTMKPCKADRHENLFWENAGERQFVRKL